jgi:fatty acid desaturase
MGTSDTRQVASAVRSTLGRDIFEPATTRLLWVPVHVSVFGASVWFSHWWLGEGGSVLALLPLALVVGMSFAGLAFVAHETLHGALTRNRTLRRVIGGLGFLPFCVSPRLWVAWHNRVHHGNTNIAGRDPDAYPTLEEAQASRTARLAVEWGAPRSRKWRGWITLAVGFTLQSLQVLIFARARGHLSPRHHRIALMQTTLGFGAWALFGVLLGWEVFVVTYLLPLMVGNAIVMAHIITNHSLSPLSSENDALQTSLTVSVPRWFEVYSLGFGYHVEHHLFPAMSNRHAPLVQQELRRLCPERYQEMPLLRALGLLFSTPRFYKTPTLLFDPETGHTYRTLGPPVPDFRPDIAGVALLGTGADREKELTSGENWTEIDVSLLGQDSGRISSIPPPRHAA